MTYALNITDPKLIDKDTAADIISFVFASEGTVTDTMADIDYSASVSFTDGSGTSPLSGLDMHCYFYADIAKQDDNFKAGIDVAAHSVGSKGEDTNPMQALGSVARTKDMITYKVDTVGMEMKAPDMAKHTINLGTDASFIFSKNILEDISMPKETVKVFETKVNEWQTIKDEITTNLSALSTLLNL